MSSSPEQENPTSVPRVPVELWWIVNLVMLLLIGMWIFSDGRSRGKLEAWPLGIDARLRFFGGSAIAWSLVGILYGLFRGPRRHRSLKAWLAFTALLSVWCALYAAWPSLYWWGQSVRMREEIAAYEPVTNELKVAWPGKDGASELLGHYLAYPLDNPRTLMPVGVASIPGATPIAAVEKSAAGALRYQLGGAEKGAWLEWHPADSAPASFTGGLQTRYTLLRQTELIPGWYLVRYREGMQRTTDN